jgi:nucleoside-diphosphate-sugar epimerase
MSEARKILVLGASGLIGRFLTDDLRARGFHVVGVARRFSPSQKASALDLELPVMSMDAASLAQLIGQHGIDLYPMTPPRQSSRRTPSRRRWWRRSPWAPA